MKLERAAIVNFRAIGELDLAFDEQLTLLVGDNAAGKTCVLSALRLGLSQVTSFFGGEKVEMEPSDIRVPPGRPPRPTSVSLTADGLTWHVGASAPPRGDPLVSDWHAWGLTDMLARIRHARNEQGPAVPLPVVAYYGVERGVRPVPPQPHPLDFLVWRRESEGAWRGALDTTTRYEQLFAWFDEAEMEELRRRRDGEPDWTSPVLQAVREAVAGVISNARNLRISPERALRVTLRGRDDREEDVDLDGLSGGYRSLLALVADLAHRMARANPTLGVRSEAIVLIDEVDLHLHPRWQQTVLEDLRAVFPNAQFIVSTHSEQVIASAAPHQVVRLDRDPTLGVVLSQPSSTFGATPDRIGEDVMGLENLRPKVVAETLERYWSLIRAGQGEEPEALALRAKLDEWFRGEDPEMVRADGEIRRQRLLRRRGDQP